MLVVMITALLAGCASNNGNNESTGNGGNSGSNQAVNSNESGAAASQTPENLNLNGYPIVQEPIKLTVMGAKSPNHGLWEEMLAFKEMESMTNIELSFDTPPQESYPERKNLAFASGELPDFFFLGQLSAADEANYGSQGILIPLEDLIDAYAPNLKAILDENPDIRKSITAPDGHIYSLPRIETVFTHAKLGARLYPHWEAFKEHGFNTMPETTEELREMLTAFKQSGMIPLSGRDLKTIRTPFLAAFGEIMNGEGIRASKDVVSFVPMSEGYKHYLDYMNKLYQDKLLDQEIFSHTFAQFKAKTGEQVVAVFEAFSPSIFMNFPEEVMYDESYPMLPVLTSEFNQEKVYPVAGDVFTGNFAITSVNQYPEATMRWADYWYSVEGSILMTQGVKVDQAWIDDPNTRIDDVLEIPEGEAKAVYAQKHFTPFAGLNNNSEIIQQKADAPLNKYLNAQTAELMKPYAQQPYPQVILTEEEQQEITNLTVDIKTYVEQMEAKFVIGQEPLSKWDSYVGTLQNMKVDRLVEIYQIAYDRWNNQ